MRVRKNNHFEISCDSTGNPIVTMYVNKQNAFRRLFGDIDNLNERHVLKISMPIDPELKTLIGDSVQKAVNIGKPKIEISPSYQSSRRITAVLAIANDDGSYSEDRSSFCQVSNSYYFLDFALAASENALSVAVKKCEAKFSIPLQKIGIPTGSERSADLEPAVFEEGSESGRLAVLSKIIDIYIPEAVKKEAGLLFDLNQAIRSGSNHAYRILASQAIKNTSPFVANVRTENFCHPLFLTGILAAERAGVVDKDDSSIGYLYHVARSALENGFVSHADSLAGFPTEYFKLLYPVIQETRTISREENRSHVIRAISFWNCNEKSNQDLFSMLDYLAEQGVLPDLGAVRQIARSCYSSPDERALPVLQKLLDMGAAERAEPPGTPAPRRSMLYYFLSDNKPGCANLYLEKVRTFSEDDKEFAVSNGFGSTAALMESIRLSEIVDEPDLTPAGAGVIARKRLI